MKRTIISLSLFCKSSQVNKVLSLLLHGRSSVEFLRPRNAFLAVFLAWFFLLLLLLLHNRFLRYCSSWDGRRMEGRGESWAFWTARIGFWIWWRVLILVMEEMGRWIVEPLNPARDGKHKGGNETKSKRRWWLSMWGTVTSTGSVWEKETKFQNK